MSRLRTRNFSQGMPRGLLRLPPEVLDVCLEELLPPLSTRPCSLGALETTPRPVDLLSLMLVCKALYAYAFPWVWRRLDITLSDKRLDLYRLPGQWECLRAP